LTHLTHALDHAHRSKPGPLRFLFQPVDLITEGVVPGLDATVIFFYRFVNV